MTTVRELTNEVNDLKRELSCARFAILSLMPEPVRQLLQDFIVGEKAEAQTEDSILETAEIDPAFGDNRALCPLCKSAGHSPYVKGYEVPKGLEAHLSGLFRARPCVVMDQLRG